MGSKNKSSDEHEVTLTLSIVQAVEQCVKETRYYETTRNGIRKRVYESVKPLHNFHIEYQLMPGPLSPVYQTDIVTYSIVAKVFTEQDERIVNIWQENGLTYYGWKHSHQLKLSLESLLSLYNHTVTVRLWNTSDKLSPKARFDRPKAFRLPAPNNRRSTLELQDSNGLTAVSLKPTHLPNVFQDAIPTKRSRRASRRSSRTIESVDEWNDLLDISPRKKFSISMVIEESDESNTDQLEHKEEVVERDQEDGKDMLSISAPESGLRSVKKEMTASQVLSIENLSVSTSRIKGMSRRRLRQLQSEAEETMRVEKEGLIVLSMKFTNLFGSQDSISAKITDAVGNVKDLDVSLSLDTPLMSEKQRRQLNPMEFIIQQATNLPPLENECKPAFIKYQFCDEPVIQTPAIHLSTLNPQWNHTQIVLLGTIENELLLEYLRGPPLTIEVHDRDQESTEEVTKGALFGSIRSDPLIGTCAYSKEIQQKCRSLLSPYGLARFDLSPFLDGLLTMEYTLPITNSTGQDYSKKSCDYTKQGSELKIKIKLSCPLTNFVHTTPDMMQTVPLRPLTPFGRIVFVISNATHDLISRLLSIVRDINLTALNLNVLPDDTKMIALSTYKLTREEMADSKCNVITGYHIDDGEKHFVICEGLAHDGIKQVWDNMPHHSTQDSAVIKVFYNSDYTFSSRLYGNLDVDLTHIKLPHPLSLIIQQTPIYIRGNIPKLCYSCLMKMNQLQLSSGLSDITRNQCLPSPLMVTALSLYCMQLQDPTVDANVMFNKEDDKQIEDLEKTATTTLIKRRRRRQLSWEPLDLNNKRYETILKERKSESAKDFMKDNIVSIKLSSDEILNLKSVKSKSFKKPHVRSYSEADSKGAVHLYSSQTYNSSVIGREVLRRQLDPNTRYTHSQFYHSRTVEPPPVEEHINGYNDSHKTKLRFQYPVTRSNVESNAHPDRPPSSRIDELHEPFIDNLLHTNKLKPTVNWAQFKWEQRQMDLDRYRPCPLDFGVKHPVTIHLAGGSRLKELKQYEEKQWNKWMGKVVVNDIKFHHLRRGIGTECVAQGPKASTQIDKLQGLLKDRPKKISYRLTEQLRVDNLPPLSLIHKNEDSEQQGVVGYIPGPYSTGSLKPDCNTIPLYKPFQPPKDLHRKDFVLYYRKQLSALLPNNNNNNSDSKQTVLQTTDF